MLTSPARVVAVFVACVIALEPAASLSSPLAGPPAAAAQGLTAVDRLVTAYDAILAARSDEARSLIDRACPPAPVAACADLREVLVWWEIQQDLSSRSLDPQIEEAARTAIAAAEAATAREPDRAEHWFYLAAAYAPLAQWRVLRGQRLAAARDGKRIKAALEQALALDPELHDAWFGIGLYHYYAGVASALLKFLRFLLLLPGGDREQGLAEMLRARDHGELLRGEADFQLHWLYLWYEEQPERALALLDGLDRRYPTNPIFLERIAQVQHEYLHDHAASAAAWQTLLDRVAAGRIAYPQIAGPRARVGLAAESIELSRPRRAIDLLAALVQSRPARPYGVLALALVTLGDAYDGIGDTTQARESYTRALDETPNDDPDGIRSRARAALARLRARR